MYSNGMKCASALCTYCKDRVMVFLCTKHIVKLKFNSHFVGD